MEGKIGKRRKLPPVQRAFVPTRLSPDVLAGAYERLLSLDSGKSFTETDVPESDPLDRPRDEFVVSTGGR